MLRLAVLLVLLPGIARAGYLESTFASVVGIPETDIVQLAGFELPAGSAFGRVLVGRYKHGELTLAEVILLACDDRQCKPTLVSFGSAELEVLGLVNLAAEGALPTVAIALPRERWFKPIDRQRRAWPALLVRATQAHTTTTQSRTMREVTGTERRVELSILSLARADAAWPRILNEVVDEHAPTGAGRTLTFELARGKGKLPDLVATERRSIDNELACLPPKPVQVRYTVDEHRRYQRENSRMPSGCH